MYSMIKVWIEVDGKGVVFDDWYFGSIEGAWDYLADVVSRKGLTDRNDITTNIERV